MLAVVVVVLVLVLVLVEVVDEDVVDDVAGVGALLLPHPNSASAKTARTAMRFTGPPPAKAASAHLLTPLSRVSRGSMRVASVY